ncbi:MAG: HypC/HybG/HupF family hydrogenase formation chaperone [Pseudomonadota bacterium]|nr:HypC/HybG/HupF family hydrogenase formation chaperone [Pseudomonadota bacterium]
MCLGIPMEIIEINGFDARCTAKGVERDVSLFMLQHEPIEVGDFVMVHVGYALHLVTYFSENKRRKGFCHVAKK